MPTRTEIVISFNEIIECLPPGKSYRRKRYNSFDANIGNEENLDPDGPSEPCDTMKPDSKKVNGSRKFSMFLVKLNKDENICIILLVPFHYVSSLSNGFILDSCVYRPLLTAVFSCLQIAPSTNKMKRAKNEIIGNGRKRLQFY